MRGPQTSEPQTAPQAGIRIPDYGPGAFLLPEGPGAGHTVRAPLAWLPPTLLP